MSYWPPTRCQARCAMVWSCYTWYPCATSLGVLSGNWSHRMLMGCSHRTNRTTREGHPGPTCSVSRWGYGEEGPAINQNNARWPLSMWTSLPQQHLSFQDTLLCFTLPSPKEMPSTSNLPMTHQSYTTINLPTLTWLVYSPGPLAGLAIIPNRTRPHESPPLSNTPTPSPSSFRLLNPSARHTLDILTSKSVITAQLSQLHYTLYSPFALALWALVGVRTVAAGFA